MMRCVDGFVGVIKTVCKDFRVTELQEGGEPVTLSTLSASEASDIINIAKALAVAEAERCTSETLGTADDRRLLLSNILGNSEVERIIELSNSFENWLESDATLESYNYEAMEVWIRNIKNMETREQRFQLHALVQEFFPTLKRKTDSGNGNEDCSDEKMMPLHLHLFPDLSFVKLKSVSSSCFFRLFTSLIVIIFPTNRLLEETLCLR
jgi:hypothetical protein